ncbi:MAG: WG repeat-containing protein [Oscillospiraceae bacterium]|nr:WG repeat-containing protein [Oscillospiraceae bacterium]
MNKLTRILIGAVCAIILISSWVVAVTAKTAAQKQLSLIEQATALIKDGIYILAAPLLEEAAEYNGPHTLQAEEELKKTYRALIDTQGFSRKYTNLLDRQMSRNDATPDVFAQAANYRLSKNAIAQALTILKNGIEATESAELIALYESCRYAYDMNRAVFDSVTDIYNHAIQVEYDGKWGIAESDGTLLISCDYDKISTLYQNRAVAKKDGVIYAVDRNNNRTALAPGTVLDFRNLSDSRIPLLTSDGWQRGTVDFTLGSVIFEDIGMYSNGYAAAMSNGKWGVIDIGLNWLVPAEYDEVICDELGRSYAQNAVFVRRGDEIYLYSNGKWHSETYHDARPFSDKGYAAVKMDNKWGFIDADANVRIGFIFDDALSFGEHLAAVKIGDMWGYISIYGNIAIDMIFLQAKSFSGASAPVLTERGWQIITLIEYKKGVTL